MQSISPSCDLSNRQLIAFPSGSRGDPLLGSKAGWVRHLSQGARPAVTVTYQVKLSVWEWEYEYER